MRPLVDYLARALVDDPSQVEVTESGDDVAKVFKLKVAKGDLGKVIGKKGRTARALRTVLAAATSRGTTRFTLEIVEPPLPPKDAQPSAVAAPVPAAADGTPQA
jgi:predicted RNA-binding protein YlqC (UPF0109 family)